MPERTTARVQEILSWYQSDSPGTLANLHRLLMTGTLGGTGKLVILPVDQGFEHGPARSFAPNPPGYDPDYHFQLAIEAGCNAYAAPLGFLEADDPRFRMTVEAIGADLKRGDFLFRYVVADDFGRPETAFTICTFWYIDALAALGRREEARALFEATLARRNRLGLYSEHIDPASGELWGNFPQTYSMVGLINSAIRLSIRWDQAF